MKNCTRQLLYIALTGAIAFQIWYNYTGAEELGGKYLDTKHLVKSVASLIPALFLGLHACKMVQENDQARKLELAHSCLAKVCSYLYLGILSLMILARLYIHF